MLKQFTMSAGIACLIFWTSHAQAESKIEVKQLHMCCSGCAEEVENILKKVDGLTDIQVTRKTRTATFSAPSTSVAQKALDALAEDGFYGQVDDKTIAFKADSGVKKEKVTSLTLTGFHNTCPGCVKAFRVALKKVDGVTGDDCKPSVTTCTIKGNFDAAVLVEALNKEGFHVKVKQ